MSTSGSIDYLSANCAYSRASPGRTKQARSFAPGHYDRMKDGEQMPEYSTDRAVPIACSLSASDAAARVARWKRLVSEAKLGTLAKDGYVRAEFRNDRAARAELEPLVAAERECCPFLQFDLAETEAALILTVTAGNAGAVEDVALLASGLGIC